MPTKRRSSLFADSEEGQAIRKQLELMTDSDNYNTPSSYSARSEIYTDNLIPFTDKHMNYLLDHASVDPNLYVSNLRLMTRLSS